MDCLTKLHGGVTKSSSSLVDVSANKSGWIFLIPLPKLTMEHPFAIGGEMFLSSVRIVINLLPIQFTLNVIFLRAEETFPHRVTKIDKPSTMQKIVLDREFVKEVIISVEKVSYTN